MHSEFSWPQGYTLHFRQHNIKLVAKCLISYWPNLCSASMSWVELFCTEILSYKVDSHLLLLIKCQHILKKIFQGVCSGAGIQSDFMIRIMPRLLSWFSNLLNDLHTCKLSCWKFKFIEHFGSPKKNTRTCVKIRFKLKNLNLIIHVWLYDEELRLMLITFDALTRNVCLFIYFSS